MTKAANNTLRQPNAARHYELSANELPWRCPVPGTRHWDSHPLVFLRPDREGKARCPYCGAQFTLK